MSSARVVRCWVKSRNERNPYGCLLYTSPALDYIVVKYPKWPFDKFVYADKSLGTQMMATGEVMSIGNSFEAAMMKAVSSIELGMDTLTHKPFEELDDDEIVAHMHVQDAERVFCVYEALKRGIDHQTIYNITKIDWWFLDKMQHLANLENGLKKCHGTLSEAQYKEAKKYGFQDKTIKRLAEVDALPVENYRAGFKMVDTCAAEFSANTPYFYSTYDGDNEAAEFIAEKEAKAAANGEPKKKKVLVFGSGPIRIGQGIEFDYCSVHCVWTLKKHGCEAILVNNNPETVSTDFDTGDRLYFDPLNPESVDNIIATEKPDACVVQFGGQTAIKLAKHMDEIGLPILGTPADAIDEAEDRERFDELLERCNIPRAPGRTVFNLDEALAAAEEIGLPVLMRPSYVLGGQNMIVAYNKADIIEYMGVITEHVLSLIHILPDILSKYKKIAVVGGGIGTAPMFQLTRELAAAGVKPDVFFGFRDTPYCMEEYRSIANLVKVSTDTGAVGFHGSVSYTHLWSPSMRAAPSSSGRCPSCCPTPCAQPTT